MKCLVAVSILLCGAALEATPWGVARGPGFEQALETRDSTGAATLTDAQLSPAVTEIVFQSSDGESVPVGLLALTNRALRISASSPTVTLRTTCETSVFRLSGGNWMFENLNFAGGRLLKKAAYFGGAIDLAGGSLTATNCSFTHLGARFAGGAVCAWLMTGDVTLTDCTFSTNWCGEVNGTGGALYASAAQGRAARLVLTNCRFAGNSAQNGGGVTTMCAIADDEMPIALVANGCAFVGNEATYSGGALDGTGAMEIADTAFDDNQAGLQGGAICLQSREGEPAWARILSQSAFRRNQASHSTDWTCGGAIAIWGEGSHLTVDGRHVVFAENEADSDAGSFGGALFVSEGASSFVSLADFERNAAGDGGGAIYGWDGSIVVSTSVFSNNTVIASGGYGGAIATEGGDLTVSNATVRFANRSAIDAYRTPVTLVNDVVVDNGGEADVTVYGSGAALRMDYVAYGRAAVSDGVRATLVTNRCLNGCAAAIYREESLRLDTSFDNPVSYMGLFQDALDYDGVPYGHGQGLFSMGAYECDGTPREPSFELANVAWYHNRANGRYYPQVTIRFLGGDAARLASVTLTCDGIDHALPESCLAELRTATAAGQTFVFGVTDDYWKPSVGDFGYIVGWQTVAEKARVMLFAVTDPSRASVSVIATAHPVSIASESDPVIRVAASRQLSVRVASAVAAASASRAATFASDALEVTEGETLVLTVRGGQMAQASSVRLVLTAQTAVSSDLDIKKGAVDGVERKLAFPLTLSWAAGDVSDRTVSLPVRCDSLREASEVLAFQLCSAEGTELGAATNCWVTIHDAKGSKADARPLVLALPEPADGGRVLGMRRQTIGRAVTLSASPLGGFVFAGWYDGGIRVSESVRLRVTQEEKGVLRTARFVTRAEDSDALTLTLGDVALESAEPATVSSVCSERVDLSLKATGLTTPTLRVSGLPTGLKLVKDVSAGGWTVSGVPTVRSRVNAQTLVAAPSKVKFVVTSAGQTAKTFQVNWTILGSEAASR